MPLVVNGEIVEQSLLEEEIERMRPRYEEVFASMDEDEREAQLRQWARDNAVERVLVNQEARRAAQPIPPKDIEEAYEKFIEQHGGEEEFYQRNGLSRTQEGEVRADIEHHLRVERLLEGSCAHLKEPTESEVATFYQEHQDDVRTPEMVGVAHIVKHVDAGTDPATARAELEKAKAELGGGADFAAVAAKYSDCPDNDGDLGLFPHGNMVEEFEHIVFSVPVGTVTDIFPSRFGFHIARVYDHRPPAAQPLDDIRDQIVDTLKEDKRREAVESFIDQLRTKAAIEDTEEPLVAVPPSAGGEAEAPLETGAPRELADVPGAAEAEEA